MAVRKLTNEEKAEMLKMYKDLIFAALDYIAEKRYFKFDITENFAKIKKDTEQDFQKGRLGRLKQVYHDATEMIVSADDLEFDEYINNKTGYTITTMSSFYKRIDKIINKGRITSLNQYHDVMEMVDKLCHTQPVDEAKIQKLNTLLIKYES